MLVDYERVLLELEGIVASKKSHGRNDLLVAIAELKADYRIPEGLPEQALRQYGNEISFEIHHGGGDPADSTRPAEAAPVSERPDGSDIEERQPAGLATSEEDTCQTPPPPQSRPMTSSASRSKSASESVPSASRPRRTARTATALS
jgi:hypothetical protein